MNYIKNKKIKKNNYSSSSVISNSGAGVLLGGYIFVSNLI
jgi:hypothetical protein